MNTNLKVKNTKIDKKTFIRVVEQFLDGVIITDFNSRSYVAKILIRDKLNYLKTCENPNDVANDINNILDEDFGVSFK